MNDYLPAQHNQRQRWEGDASSPSSLLSSGAEETSLPARPSFRNCLMQPNGWLRQLWIWSCLVFCSVLSYTLCNQFIYTSVVVQGKSMLPTLRDGDHYLLNRWLYHYNEPQRGDLIVLRDPGHSDFAVKRIVGLPGEIVHVKGGRVYVNERVLPEPYLLPGENTFPPKTLEQLVKLGKDEYFVLGDNRTISEDSRYYGPISRENIAGLLAIK